MEQVIEKPKRIRIKKDVFKNAEFGKLYRMRDGSKAVFLKHKYMSNDCVVLIEYGWGFAQLEVSNKGKHYPNKNFDIVAEWES
jgi:hypothetical protein